MYVFHKVNSFSLIAMAEDWDLNFKKFATVIASYYASAVLKVTYYKCILLMSANVII